MTKTIVLIHGLWLTSESWDRFQARYEGLGYRVLTPGWPLEKPTEAQRASPDPAFARVGLREIVDHHERLIRALPEPPILIGHSTGGLITQLLLDRGLGAAGVAIEPVPPRGVIPRPPMLVQALPVLATPLGWRRIFRMSFPRFASAFMNVATPQEQREAYDRYVVPAPGRIYFQAAFGVGSGVWYRNPARAPLLIVAADHDRTVTPSTIAANHRKQARNPARTDFVVFRDRSHFLIADRRWQEVADHVLRWAEVHQRGPTGVGRVRLVHA